MIPIAVMTMSFHLIGEVEKQLGIKFVAQFRYFKELARLREESRMCTEAIRQDGIQWSRNLHLLYKEIERRKAETATPPAWRLPSANSVWATSPATS